MGAGGHVPQKFGEKYFYGNFYVKFGHFLGRIMQNLGILLIFHTYFWGKNFVPP